MSSYLHVDEKRVTGLTRELAGDVSACARFLREFATAWEGRLARLDRALASGDHADADAVLLSVSTSSTMLGAHDLAAAAKDARRELRDLRLSAGAVDRLREIGDASRSELLAIADDLAAQSV